MNISTTRIGGFTLVLVACAAIACGGGGGEAGGGQGQVADASVQEGAELFKGVCATCHGAGGEGVPNLGKDMRGSEWVKSQTDEQMLEFLKNGRKATDPLNTTGVEMPPRGGNPKFTDEDLEKIVQYVRTL